MGTRRNIVIATQHENGLAAPLRDERLWRRVHRDDAWRAQGRRCKYCREPLKAEAVTADHKLARRNGGITSAANIIAACQPCNTAKGSLPERAFQKAIRAPTHEHRMAIWVASFRRRIWVRCEMAQRRILKVVGLEELME